MNLVTLRHESLRISGKWNWFSDIFTVLDIRCLGRPSDNVDCRIMVFLLL